MGLERIIILSLLVTQALCAPNGCIESCTSYHRTYQSQQSGAYRDLGSVTQGVANLENLDYSRPGNWTEHNQYKTNDGHGKVHEERGQYVEGPKRVRYYKKNFTSSYSTGSVNGAGLSEIEQQSGSHGYGSTNVHDSQQILGSQRAYDRVGASESQITQQQHEYNRILHQQNAQTVATGSHHGQSARLEDFGEYSGHTQQVAHQGVSDVNSQAVQGQYHYTDTQPGNWTRVDSYKTDAGHGRVFEEEGQYVTGPKKVRYYKRNYTSSYRSGPIATGEFVTGAAHDLQREIEKLHKELGRELHQVSTAGNTATSDIVQTSHAASGYERGDLQAAESDVFRQHANHGSTSSSMINHNTDHRIVDTSSGVSEQLPYRNPSQNVYGTESHNSYERHEGYVARVQPTMEYVRPTPGYTRVRVGSSEYDRNTLSRETEQHILNEMRRAEEQSRLVQNQMSSADHMRQSIHDQQVAMHPSTPGHVRHYKEWSSSSHTRESTLPHLSTDSAYINEHNAQYQRNQYEDQQNSYRTTQGQNSYLGQVRENGYNSGYRATSGSLVTGDTVDCAQGTSEQIQYGRQYHRNYKRSANYQDLDDIQQHQSQDLIQQTQQTQQHVGHMHQQSQDLTESQDLLQQTTGNLEFGQQTQETQKPQRLTFGHQNSDDLSQQSQDLTQQVGGFDDLTQQTTGKLEFGQQTDQLRQSNRPTSNNQDLEDLTQQTGGFDDFTQQTVGKLELGQQTQHPYQHGNNQQSQDLTQQTGDFDDLTQQTGHLELGQQSQKPYWRRKPNSDSQHSEDLTQQTGDFDDLTQQTHGNLEFGQNSQQSQKPHWQRKPTSDSQHSEDLTQQTGDFDDLTQQTHGNLEFGQDSQQSQKPYWQRKPNSGSQHSEDLTQQTGDFDDLTQQTHGNLEFGQNSQQSQKPHWQRKPNSGSQHSEDLTQQTGDFDDLTQQTHGDLEFGQNSQQSQKPHWQRKPNSGSQHSEDLTQQTGDFDDLTQQTHGNLEFGQNSPVFQKPRKPNSGNQYLEDLTQQNEDLTQQTGGFDDFTQQLGKLEIGQQSQQSHQQWKPHTGNQHADLTQQNEDLTQQTGGFDDFTQQFGKPSQVPHQQWKPHTGNQHADLTQQNEDLTQQTGGFDDFTQQLGKLEFGHQSQVPHQQRKPDSMNQHSDLTQQTGGFDDFTQQTSGNLEFGQHTQQSQHWKPFPTNQHMGDLTQQNEDLTQQTGGFDDLTQQSGSFGFGQQTQPGGQWKPKPGSQYLGDLTQQNEDLTQQTGGFDDFTQQVGKLQFGQQTQQGDKYKWDQDLQQPNWNKEDLTQQTAQHPFGVLPSDNNVNKIQIGDYKQQSESPHSGSQYNSDEKGVIPLEPQGSNTPAQPSVPRPAEKPKPRPRYPRIGLTPALDRQQNQNTLNTSGQRYPQWPQSTNQIGQTTFTPHKPQDQEASEFEGGDTPIQPEVQPIPDVNAEPDTDDLRKENLRGDQETRYPIGKDNPKDLSQQTQVNAFDTGRINSDQVNRLHKSNDATVGLQWHYTYHPSDLTNSEPVHGTYYPSLNYNSGGQHKEMTGQYEQSNQNNEDLQQQTKPVQFGQQKPQDAQNFRNMYQQSSNMQSSHSQYGGSFDQQTQNRYTNGNSYQETMITQSPLSQHTQHNVDQETGSYQQSQNPGLEQLQLGQKEDDQQQMGQLEFSHPTKGSRRNHQRPHSEFNGPEHKLEPRILEAYGGGPYDAEHGDDIYNNVTPNPSATLAPVIDIDSWDIREKPRDVPPVIIEPVNPEPTEIVETATEVAPPSFWGRLGHKITNTFDKAKEKARGIFG